MDPRRPGWSGLMAKQMGDSCLFPIIDFLPSLLTVHCCISFGFTAKGDKERQTYHCCGHLCCSHAPSVFFYFSNKHILQLPHLEIPFVFLQAVLDITAYIKSRLFGNTQLLRCNSSALLICLTFCFV